MRAKGALDVQARVLASMYRAWSNYCTNKTMVARSRQQAILALIVLLMNAGEFTERREVVKDSLGIDKLPILHIFS